MNAFAGDSVAISLGHWQLFSVHQVFTKSKFRPWYNKCSSSLSWMGHHREVGRFPNFSFPCNAIFYSFATLYYWKKCNLKALRFGRKMMQTFILQKENHLFLLIHLEADLPVQLASLPTAPSPHCLCGIDFPSKCPPEARRRHHHQLQRSSVPHHVWWPSPKKATKGKPSHTSTCFGACLSSPFLHDGCCARQVTQHGWQSRLTHFSLLLQLMCLEEHAALTR